MKSDQDIIYEAVRDAWLIRLREVNIDVSNELIEIKKQMHETKDVLEWIEIQLTRIENDSHSADSEKSQT